ncbi:Nitrilase-like protein 2 [Glycine max]|nr:Nitrilase-like protein 2 [Glycine max]
MASNLAANMATCSHLLKEAASAGAKLLCFPEAFSYVGTMDGDSVLVAEPLDGPIMNHYCSLARFDVDVPGGRVYKESSFTESVLPQRNSLSRKSEGKGEGECLKEKISTLGYDMHHEGWGFHVNFFCFGDVFRLDIVAVDSPIGRLGLSVCYDLRFPEMYQLLRFQHEAQVLLVPAAFTTVTGEAHWEILLRARVIETQCYVIAAAQAGKHNDKRESYGNTLIIDPWGTIVGRLPDRLSTGIVVADIDLSFVDSVREKMPIAKQRKPIDFWKAASL